ncbi:type II toxin-antitoxin system RelE/ParE family toxin [Actinobacillus genomosp. 2]|uniref:type II toxin-antitoxin system RelE/ParE family toxin n=1 Tax=Actinobacillus genomosp. 2 TaxID=230709 RepID=UPI00244164AD|nr:type II toxin-antitoxin system RelE/ParE family toxin [Actinobacillus genomosp. 2]WGE32013.1 type II toxin-antitoxin system RelE/ParE family toxin [Actinobacillus genomosp. 2]
MGLLKQSHNDNREKLQKISHHLSILHLHGTRAGENYIKHLEDRIWQIRPMSDCLLLTSIIRGQFVLLHYLAKSHYRIPKREIERAKSRLADLQARIKDEPYWF